MAGVLSLGGIEFEEFELPERINQGGEHDLAVHKILGGRRVVDAMGPDDAPIAWSGIFMGETAQLRALRLDMLRRSGRNVELAFGLRLYEVVVQSFTATIERPMLVRYDISCVVVRDLVAGEGGSEEAATAEQEIEADLVAAEADIAARNETQYAISIASQAVRAALGDKAAQRGTLYVATAAAQEYLGNALYEAGADATTANLALAGVQGVAGVIQGGDPIQMATTALGATDASVAAYNAQTTVNALTRASRGLGQLSA